MARRQVIRVTRAYGPVVEGEAVLSREGFSPRYDLDDRPVGARDPYHLTTRHQRHTPVQARSTQSAV
ncbi:MAG: hypothetical protein ACT4P8_19315, partial [Betaproteobacteria bacterium]